MSSALPDETSPTQGTSESNETSPPQAPTTTESRDSTNTAELVSQSAAGSKRPLMTATKDGKPLSDKKLRRLEKNRLSARECRRRKREATESLEGEINVLEGENLRLRLQLQIGEEAEDSMTQEQTKLTVNLDSLLKSGASEAEIFGTIEEFKEKFADYGRDRRSAIEFHLRNVERLLMPTKTTSIAMRALHGGSGMDGMGGNAAAQIDATDEEAEATPTGIASPVSVHSTETTSDSNSVVLAAQAPDPSLEPKGLFQFLVNYLEVTPEQGSALKDSRWVARELDECLVKSLDLLADLRTRLTQCGEDLESEFNTVRSILTPTQAAKFLVWVANNSACMHMLNELWSDALPEPSTGVRQESQSTSDSDTKQPAIGNSSKPE